MITLIGVAAGILCAISFFPQVVRVFKTKKTADLSMATFSLFALGITLWLVYGCLLGNIPIILANALMLIFILAIVFAKIKYR